MRISALIVRLNGSLRGRFRERLRVFKQFDFDFYTPVNPKSKLFLD
jgi:hypothetical protein